MAQFLLAARSLTGAAFILASALIVSPINAASAASVAVIDRCTIKLGMPGAAVKEICRAAGSSCKVVDYDGGARSATLEIAMEATSVGTSAGNVVPHFAGKTYYGDARDKMEDLGYSPVVPDRSRRECEQENLGREDVCRRWPEVESCAGTGFARCTFLWRRGRTTIEIRTVGDKVELVDRVSCRTGCPQ